ncbi:MAG: DUF3291 domain-containing protein [Chloroflexota bacterium]|nr:DUF3291 domain-containing protein [Chloroflexota bacterium]
MSTTFHIAQLNLARMLTSLDDPSMKDFVDNVPRVNQIGIDTPGFVWILKGDGGDATLLRPFGDDVLINMTVWESIDALFQYAYYSDHAQFFRRRAEWFQKAAEAMVVLWWVPAGHQPTLEEADARIQHLRQHGPTPYAFTFKQRFTVDELLAWEQAQAATVEA